MTNIHTVTLDDGTVAKRTSKNRVYTHCVAVEYDLDYLRKQAEGIVPRKGYMDSLRATWVFLVKNAHETIDPDWPDWKKNNRQKDKDEALATLKECPTFNTYVMRCREEEIERCERAIETGYYDPGVVTWCGSRDLAEKAASPYRGKPRYKTVKVLPVTHTTK